jgi:hypothetical protein
MGKTQNPLRILLTSTALLHHQDLAQVIAKMVEQGHVVDIKPELGEYNFIGGPNCWYLVPEVAALFGLAVDNARKLATIERKAHPKPVKKPAKKKGGKAKHDPPIPGTHETGVQGGTPGSI